jgi:septal ring factor EnvC (AmiA/AmiB activator)
MKKLCALFVLCLPFCLSAQAPDLDTAESLIGDSMESLEIIESENANLSEQLATLRREMENWNSASETQKSEWMKQLEALNSQLAGAEAQRNDLEKTSKRYKGLSIAGGASTGGLLIALLLILLL